MLTAFQYVPNYGLSELKSQIWDVDEHSQVKIYCIELTCSILHRPTPQGILSTQNILAFSRSISLNSKRLIEALLFTAILLALIGCDQAATPPPAPTATPAPAFTGKIVAVGDSLTEGLGVEVNEAYPALLADKLQADGYQYEVVNAGVSGETSSGALSRIDWLLKLEPDIVILETGGNDGLRGINTDLTKDNISTMIDRFQENDIDVILAGMQTIQNLGQEYTEAYAEIYPTVAEDKDVLLIPFFLEGVAAEPELNQEDGIHPTAEGYQIVLETVYPYVVEAIEAYEAGL